MAYLLILVLLVVQSVAAIAQNNDPWWLNSYNNGLKLIEQKQYQAARQEFEKILQRDKKLARAHYGVGLSYAAEKPDSDKALEHFERATQLDKKFAPAYYQAGLVRFNREKYQDARKDFLMATRSDPTFVDAWIKLGETEVIAGESARAVEAYQNAYKNDPGSKELYEKLMGVAISTHEEDRAIEFLKKLPAGADSLRRLTDIAYLSYTTGDLDKMISVLAQVPAEASNARTYLLLAVNNFSNENDETGLAYFWSAVNGIKSQADAEVFYRDCAYIMRNDEYEVLQELPLEDVWKFYYRFWRSRDPDHSTDINERVPEHYRRLLYARKWYRRYSDSSDRRYKLEHPLRDFVAVKVGSEMLGPSLSGALAKKRDLDDMGLIYVRHGKPDLTASHLDPTDESLPQNLSWRYNAAWNRPEMIFHFAKWGGEHGWVLTSVPVTFYGLWEFGSHYIQLDPERPERPELTQADLDWLYEQVHIANMEYARIAAHTETTDYTYPSAEPLDFPLHFASFRGEESKILLEIYYGISGRQTQLRPTERGLMLDLEEFFGLYDEKWNEVGKTRQDIKAVVNASPEVWKSTSFTDVVRFQTAPGRHSFEIQVRDRTSGRMGFYKGEYVMEDLWAQDSLVVSDVIVSGPIGPAKSPGKFVKEDVAYSPHMFNDFTLGEQFGLYFEIYNLRYNDEGQTNFRITCTLRPFGAASSKSSSLLGSFRSLFDKEKQVVGTSYDYSGQTSNEKIYINLDPQEQPAGRYQLLVEVQDVMAGTTVRKSVEIEIRVVTRDRLIEGAQR